MANRLGTGILPASKFRSVPVRFLQIVAIAMVAISTFGNYVTFNGGWSRAWVMDEATTYAIGYAIGWGALTFAVQWGCKQDFGTWWWLYLLCLVASFAPSFMTYNPVVFPMLSREWGEPAAYVVITAVLLVNDIIPEWVLLD